MNIEKLALNSNSEGYGLSHVPKVSLATGLLKQSLDKSTRYCCLSDEPDKETEESGLYYIAKNDAGKKLEDIVFEKDYLPRGNEFKRRVAFLDRDGILIKDTDYPGKIEDVIFLPEVLSLLESLK